MWFLILMVVGILEPMGLADPKTDEPFKYETQEGCIAKANEIGPMLKEQNMPEFKLFCLNLTPEEEGELMSKDAAVMDEFGTIDKKAAAKKEKEKALRDKKANLRKHNV